MKKTNNLLLIFLAWLIVSGCKKSGNDMGPVSTTSPNEIELPVEGWLCPMGCTAVIDNLYYYIRRNTPLFIYVRIDDMPGWSEAIPADQWASNAMYGYEISDDRLLLYTTLDKDATDTVIKIVW